MTFFTKNENFKPAMDETFKELCDSDLLLDELDAVCLGLLLDKAPGTEGLTTSFYHFFSDDLR